MDDSKGRLILLDLARFLAAIAVVIFHYKSIYIETLPAGSDRAAVIYAVTKFGYLGVDLFFLISGFVIFASALNRSPLLFLISRAIRIYPTFWVCATVTWLLILSNPEISASYSLTHYLVNLTLLHEYAGLEGLDAVYWTLVVELKFYGCIFILALLGWLKFFRYWLVVWLVATVAFAFFGQPYFMGWFISPEYSPYFISGIIFFLAQREGYNRLYISILGIAFLMALRHAYLVADTFTHDISTIDRFTVMAIVSSFYLFFYLVSRNKLSLQYRNIYLILGGMTYPLYLLHNFGGKIIFAHLVHSLPPFILIVAISLLMLCLSYVINTWFEKRFVNRIKLYLFNNLENITSHFKLSKR